MSRPASMAGRRALRSVASAAAGVPLALVLLAGCGGEKDAGEARPSPGDGRATPSAALSLPRSIPTRIKIPKIDVNAPISQLGLNPDGTVEEPPLSDSNLAGWYNGGPTPGEVGPSVILGHVDAHHEAAVFFRVGDLQKGDRIKISREDGSVPVFAVTTIEQVAKASFPRTKVYGEKLDHAALRLVTCGGDFNAEIGHYVDNIIVYATLIETGSQEPSDAPT